MEIDIVPFQARLERLAFNNHIQVVQFAALDSTDNKEFTNFSRAMVLGQSFGDTIMEKFGSKNFGFHLDLIKHHISNVAYRIYHLLVIEGYEALILEPMFLKGDTEFSDFNREIAKLAGVGTTGENGFFISPVFGVKLVLCSILTNAPLEFDPEYTMELCKKCSVCKENDYSDSIVKCPYGKNRYINN